MDTGQDWLCPTDTFVSRDALVLALRLQETMFLDTALALEIDAVLQAARETIPQVSGIRARGQTAFACNELIMRSYAPWIWEWEKGHLMTGNAALDSLSVRYNFLGLGSEIDRLNIFLIEFGQALKMPWLSLLYKQIDGVDEVGPNGPFGDGPDIEAFKKDGVWHLAFSNAWGDCPAGGIMRYYYYVIVDDHFNVSLVDERERSWYEPIIYTWNIPRWYAATAFDSGDEVLLASSSSSQWWVRRYGIEILGRILAYRRSWSSLDDRNRVLFDRIKNDLLSRPGDVRDVLSAAKYDSDRDIREAARFGLNHMDSLFQYFPLKKGNCWTYACQDGATKESSIIRNAWRWYGEEPRPERNCLFDWYEYPLSWVWMDRGAQVFMRVDEMEQMWIDFTADVGSSWEVEDYEDQDVCIKVTLESAKDTISTLAGIFPGCFRFCFEPESGRTPWTEWYARGTGPVKRVESELRQAECMLAFAIINGQSIGGRKGDVNSDHVLDVQDVIAIVNCILNREFPSMAQEWAADFNGDGRVNVLDVVSLIHVILGT